ncbi:MAG TPA: FAD-binding protein [Thermodesulfobacteriota bacterium]|nr:FAD-binding protein [Thermodesulfobacteriota bacterium]
MFDLAIIGAGPAGATLARLVGKKYSVLLIDKRSFSDRGDCSSGGKCCGGLLAPDAQRALSELGLGLPKRVLEGPQLFVVRAIDARQGVERYYQRHYINMDRREFDDWLLSIVPSDVDLRTGCPFESYSSEDANFKIRFSRGGRTYEEEAKILVGADGASSRLRAQAASGDPFPAKYIAIQEWVEGDGRQPHFTSVFDPELTDYYCWTIPKGDRLLVGAALRPGQDASAKFTAFKQTLKGMGFRIGRTLRREGGFILRPRKTNELFPCKGRLAFIGEAAGWISPSSAEGISYAFRSARALAEALPGELEGLERRHREKTKRLQRNILLKILKSRLIFHPAFRKMVMKSGIQTVHLVQPEDRDPSF